ncbi:HD domain-containing protein [Sediminibacillus massiliensis]|uniref:HD domain-containing protein n=1 Tax=Sediminibacillus massiliensis TaxID=1926277 RepID=UPI0009888C0D|nr:HD domain-containing protein [Sediminibacillus massiliensis]
MNEKKFLSNIQSYVYGLFHEDPTGHDYHHMKRVALTARRLATIEGADPFIAEVSGWLHDIGDAKLFADGEEAKNEMKGFLRELGLPEEMIKLIELAVADVSFSKGTIPDTMEGKVVQDADRLDAIGAIGIARTFAYGGAKNQLLFDEEKSNTSIQHFYDKLLLLKELMNTESGKSEAAERHRYMESFLEQFFREWKT